MCEVVTIVVAVNTLVKVDAVRQSDPANLNIRRYRSTAKLTYYSRGDKSVVEVINRAISQQYNHNSKRISGQGLETKWLRREWKVGL